MITVRVSNLDEILNLFEVLQVATAISADVVVPLENLSNICINVSPTCMRFTKADDTSNSEAIERFFNDNMSTVFTLLLSGNGSDGALTRETKGMENMTLKNPDGTSQPTEGRYIPLGPDCPIIGMGGHIVKLHDNDLECVTKMHTQDMKHLMKRMVGQGQSVRNLTLGGFNVSVQIISDEVGKEHNGGLAVVAEVREAREALTASVSTVALRRADRMNVGHVQNLIKLQVQNMLLNSNSGETVQPTRLFLSVLWKFRMMFFAMWIPIEERIKWNGYIITFLFAWYHYVKNTKKLDMTNFITMQTFRDMIITCNSWMLYFINARDINPDQLESFSRKLGSDACETLFSGFGGWGAVAGCRNITVLGAQKMFSKTVTLKSLRSDQDNNGILVAGRATHHNEETLQMKQDEIDLGYNEDTVQEPFGNFSNERIKSLLQRGADEALAHFREIKAFTPPCQHSETLYSYKDLCYHNQVSITDDAPVPDEDDAYDRHNDDNPLEDWNEHNHGEDDDNQPDDNHPGEGGDNYPDGQHEYIARRVIRAPHDIIMPSTEQLQEAEDANLFEAAQIRAIVLNDEDNINDDSDEIGSNTGALDHVGVAVVADNAFQRHVMHGTKRPSKYQIDIGGGKTMHITTLLALLSAWYVANRGTKLSKDRIARIIQSARTSKSQTDDNGGTIARGVVESNGADIVVSGSWIAIAFEDDSNVGHFRSWIGMIQRIVFRPKGKKASLWTSTLSLDDERIKDMWLNMAWLSPCDGASPREALEYTWLPFSDAEEVCASFIINIPEVTLCQDTMKYILCTHDLRRLNAYLDSITHILEPETTSRKKKGREKDMRNKVVAEGEQGISRTVHEGREGKRTRIAQTYSH